MFLCPKRRADSYGFVGFVPKKRCRLYVFVPKNAGQTVTFLCLTNGADCMFLCPESRADCNVFVPKKWGQTRAQPSGADSMLLCSKVGQTMFFCATGNRCRKRGIKLKGGIDY